MKLKTLLLLLTVLVSQSFARPNVSSDYDARIDEKEILTPLPDAKPQINGAKIYGARADRQFLFRIPCQGVRPITFTVKGLPEGLSVNSEGIITGRTPKDDGEYKMTITAKNRKGSVTRDFTLVVGDKLALTPPTGWNSWGGYMLYVSDKVMRNVADFFVEKGLADVGYQYVGIDDCWMRISPEKYENLPDAIVNVKHAGFDYTPVIGEPRDEKGNIQPNSNFPDMKALTDHIHSYGLKTGIYSSPGNYTCQQWTGSYNYEAQDADQYAAWGFDLLKYDMCSGGIIYNAIVKEKPTYRQFNFWRPMVSMIKNQDRDILFNLCQYGREEPWTWAPSLGIQTWRMSGDLNHHIENYFQSAMTIATELRDFNKPGQWNDPDFMYIQYIRDARKMGDPCIEIPLTTNQRYQYVTLWSMVCAPFVFSCNVDMMDDFTIRLLSNTNLMNINQDELAHTAEVIRNENNEVIMVKRLADGSKAVAIFNQDPEKEANINVLWSDMGECCEKEVYDAWRGKDLGTYKGGITTTLSPYGVVLYIVK